MKKKKKSRDHFAGKGPSSQSYGFSSSHVWMWELDYKESWYFWTVALEKTLESPLDCKEIKPLHPGVSDGQGGLVCCDSWGCKQSEMTELLDWTELKENQLWIFTGRTDAETEALVLWPPDAKSQLIGKEPVVGKDWRQEEKGITEDEMAGWHHWLNGHEFEQTPGDDKGQGSLVCCSPWGHKELDPTERLNNNLVKALRGAPLQISGVLSI